MDRTAYICSNLSDVDALRPVVTSLNGDNSWIFSFPRPDSSYGAIDKTYYHIVFEPWLKGPSTVLGSWFVNISLGTSPVLADVEAIERVIQEIELAARNKLGSTMPLQNARDPKMYNSGIDAIFLGFHYSDHVHIPTLRLFDPRIPIVATPEAAKIVSGLSHFNSIATIRDFPSDGVDWTVPHLHPGGSCPTWITPLRLPGHHELNFCNVILWSYEDCGEEKHETLLISPHGTRLDEGPLQAFLESQPKTTKLLMLHGLKESYTAKWQTTLGVKGGLALYRRCGEVKYWIAHHSSKLNYNGILMWGLWTNDVSRTIEWGLEEEIKDGLLDEKQPLVLTVANGASFVLK